MTEARATGGAASKLRPTAKEFVFNSSAPAWTPPSAATPEPTNTPKPSVLKPSAKAFVPSFMAPVFVPATIAPPTPAAASPVAPVIVGQRTEAFVKRTAAVAAAAASSSSTTTTATSVTATTSEPEAEDRTDVAAAPKAEEVAAVPTETLQEQTAAVAAPEEKETEPLLHAEATVGINGAVQPAPELPRAPVSTPVVAAPVVQEEVKEEVVVVEETVEEEEEEEEESETEVLTAKEAEVTAEQEVIKERIMYTIKQLLELEPDSCPMPASVKGLVVAADKTSKTAATLADAPSRGSSRGGSRRSLSRHNSSSSFGGDNGGRGRRERGGGRGRGGHHDTAPALEDCEPLSINEETRWKPSVAKSRLDEAVDTTEASVKEAKSILNKLSVEKFDKLSDQLIVVAVRGIDVLKAVIDMVIEKAQMEWHFSAMYAELCAKLAKTSMPAITLDDKEVVTDTHKLFRKLLLQRCQKEFEDKPSVEGLEDLPEDVRQEKELLVKRATLGHIRFVGELFKQRMLSSRIMHECVGILFGDLAAPDEESLECLCKLLSTIGQALEQNAREQGERDLINKYYATIRQLSGESKLLCTRVRFMLQDLLELRRNNWVARRKETKAMTIAEVHAEVAREAKEKEKAAKSSGGARLQRSQSMNSAGGSDRRRGSQGVNGGGGASAAWKARAASSSNLAGLATAAASSSSSSPSTPVTDDGWSTVTGGAKPKLLKSRSNSDRFPSSMNAPTSGAPRHPNSARGVGSNSFASLRQDERSSRKERSRSNSASSNSLRTGLGRPPMSSSSSSSQRSTSPSRESSAASSTPEPLSADVFKKKAKAILDEFVELRDLDEAVASVNELHSSEHHSLIATQALNLGLDKGDTEREAVAALLAGLLDQDLLSTDGLMVALDDLLEFVEDMEIDIPKTLPYLSEMLAPTVASGGLPLARLVASVQHITYNGKAAKLVGGTLAAIGDEDKVRAVVAVDGSSAVEFAELLAENQRGDDAALRTFYETYSLQFLL